MALFVCQQCQTSSVVLRMQGQMKLLKQDVLSAAHVDLDTSAILTSVQAELEVKDKDLITTVSYLLVCVSYGYLTYNLLV